MVRRNFNFRGVAANDAAFRGMAAEIGDARTVDEGLEISRLAWTVARRPYQIVGVKGVKDSRFKALVRSDNGYEIAPASESYTPIQNRQLMATFFQAAGDAGVKLSRAGCYDGGARVFASAEMPASFSLPVGTAWEEMMRRNPDHGWAKEDKTVLQIVMTSGHEPGYKARIMAQAWRLICLNGARVTRSLGEYAVAHRGNAVQRLFNVQALMAEAVGGFQQYGKAAQVLRDTRSTREMDRAYAINLLAPEAWAAIMAETEERVNNAHPGRLAGSDLLNAVIERTHTAKFEAALQERSVAAVLDAIQTQPGAAMAAGTLWGTYNAVTYHVDHRAGRSVDSGLDGSLFGAGDKLKTRAMDLALVYAEAAGNRAVVDGRLVN